MITRLMSPVYRVVIDYLLLVLLVMTLGACAKPPKVEVIPEVKIPPLEAVSWEEIDGWRQENPVPALEVFLKSCQALKARSVWQGVCAEAATINLQDSEAVRNFFKIHFTPYRVHNPDGSNTGIITGYYAPDLNGSRNRSERYSYPLYGVPDDLLVVDLSSVYPELAGYRLRGRVQGRKVVPYWCRAEIDGENTPLKGKELFWVADPVELFFLHIQGSGRISLNTGERVMVHYADQNGYPYRSIGKLLIEQGEMTLDQMSMQNIKSWAQNNPDKVGKLLGENPSYIFFSKLPADVQSPPGALDIPLTAGRSLAVDPRTIPLGAPVFIATTWPGSSVPLQRLMVAQDTGGAIKGPVRADFFWGLGNKAGALAGRMKQEGRLWVLLPAKEPPMDGDLSVAR
jgi:membrane-bound lytic murein transglycosylase A